MNTAKILGAMSAIAFIAGCASDEPHTTYRGEPTYSGPVASTRSYETGTDTRTYPSTDTRTYPSTSPRQYPSTSTSPRPMPRTYPSPSYPSTTYPSSRPVYSPPTQGSGSATQVMSNTDVTLANSVRDQFNRYGDLATAAQQVQITARNGTVTLAGFVPSQRERQMIQAVVRNTPGVVSVSDQLQISAVSAAPPPATAPPPVYSQSAPVLGQSDQALASQLQQALAAHPTLGGFASNIRVTVQNGRVTLTGSVPSEQDREMVTDLITDTTGVVSVNDQLTIASLPTGRISQAPGARVYPTTDPAEMINLTVQGLSDADRAVAQRILDGVRTDASWAPPLQPIHITIDNSQVTLEGTVQSHQQKRDIAAAIQRAAGVNSVYDNLQVIKSP